MKQWKYCFLAAVPLLLCGSFVLYFNEFDVTFYRGFWRFFGSVVFLWGLFAGTSGLYYYSYHRDRELEQ